MSFYRKIIVEILADLGREDVDPRHVEAYMRLQYGSLGHVDRETFRREARIAIECIKITGVDDAEELAESFGL